ncbi:polysaccharide biosynthesis tyrosine autokinase [Mumia sp. zg.B53]|uniref:polysaccharide biosynthesis tyrosine autokinase n=1 Tax=Mumia sp. zg.B53 TaxID=2855449 RepID=UPI001C6E8804|nr:polysaccharide biosynthesis tyrosine autokinase [Mumia sp. zg.B53]MBW9215377.1 polysaccharide biosynthesis tyrosine autokinase [Mumia sp. zg.B53]
MDSNAYLQVLRRRWLAIVLLAALGGAFAAAYVQTVTPQYRSTATLFYALARTDSVSELVQGSDYTREVVKSYASVARTPRVLTPVIDDLDLDTTPRRLAGSITASAPLDQVIIDVTATSASPVEAAQIANATARSLATESEALAPKTRSGRAALDVSLISTATTPEFPFSPNKKLYVAGGLAAGLGVGLALALILERLGSRVRTEADVEAYTEAPVLARIPRQRSRRVTPAAHNDGRDMARSEAVRRLQINLESLGIGLTPGSVMVTSARPGEGKTTTTVDLAAAMSEAGHRVLLVDADLRRPRVASYLGLEGSVGLTNVLAEQVELENVVQPWLSENLHVLPGGFVRSTPAQVLGSEAMRRFLRDSLMTYDIVLLDAAPLMPVADSVALAKLADGTLLVVDSRSSKPADFKQALQVLSVAGASLVGVVLNKTTGGRSGQYGYDQRPRRFDFLRRERDPHENRAPALDRTGR